MQILTAVISCKYFYLNMWWFYASKVSLKCLWTITKENLILQKKVKILQKKFGGINQKTASMRVAHCCKCFPFFFRLIPRLTEKKTIDLVFSVFQQRNRFKRRFISIFWRRRDTYDVKIQFFNGWRNNHNFLTNQMKRYAITLINITWYIIN